MGIGGEVLLPGVPWFGNGVVRPVATGWMGAGDRLCIMGIVDKGISIVMILMGEGRMTGEYCLRNLRL